MTNRVVTLTSLEDTDNFAKEIAATLSKGDVLALYGDLGVGKTYFTSCLCAYLGSSDTVNSPSYLIMNEYNGKYPIFHLDLYRLGSQDEVLELGLHELFENGISIIEWPQLAEFIMPTNTLKLFWTFDNNNRKVEIVR